MARTILYNQEDNRDYYFNFVLEEATDVNGQSVVYLTINTTLVKSDGSSFDSYKIEDLTDTPPDYGTASSFTELCEWYYEYFTTESQITVSSSSSDSTSSSSSSSSSSEEFSTSSSSSSSSSTTII